MRDRIKCLIAEGKTSKEIMAAVGITNGKLRYEVNHIAADLGLGGASLAAVKRALDRSAKREGC